MQQVGSDRVGVCFDTCHAFAAGYDIRTTAGFDDTMEQLDKTVGLDNVLAFHLNDSKNDYNTRKDLHENLVEGLIGLEPFRQIMNRFPDVPKVIETPKEDDWDMRNLAILRGLFADS